MVWTCDGVEDCDLVFGEPVCLSVCLCLCDCLFVCLSVESGWSWGWDLGWLMVVMLGTWCWCCGVVVLWCCGVVVLWCCGVGVGVGVDGMEDSWMALMPWFMPLASLALRGSWC
ncbi:uncharacterized protein PV06_03582 [Exophiala oligosperma]|uniref:Uncharacterized protein n=1 Tax=Exophiala oligosperma TaxID=215243 RepID=A0A0D2EB08_9EURO|nr:uncharacterized protein PV06_03582 [Exophiala oligosperma]KIW45179.1 hypothetical protein PV06_03582 [Exophiala oligosperma]